MSARYEAWAERAMGARASAGMIRRIEDRDIVTEYAPKLAGKFVSDGELRRFPTRAEAVEEARRLRGLVMADAAREVSP